MIYSSEVLKIHLDEQIEDEKTLPLMISPAVEPPLSGSQFGASIELRRSEIASLAEEPSLPVQAYARPDSGTR